MPLNRALIERAANYAHKWGQEHPAKSSLGHIALGYLSRQSRVVGSAFMLYQIDNYLKDNDRNQLLMDVMEYSLGILLSRGGKDA
tara:strand:+ start:815 stop:1069 length:255 start_codon:yes stop_codon:yes gene_type:complete